MKKDTKYIHGGQQPDPSTGAIMTPIYQTSTYVQKTPGDHKGYEYSRTLNPTRHALEKSLASIENGKYAACFGSGMAATDTVCKLLSPGDHVISTADLYGGTYRLFTKTYAPFGIDFTFMPLQDVGAIKNAATNKTKLIWVETPTNPTLGIADIEAIAAIAKEIGAILVVDNTFASPALQNPLDMGADIVMHSATKFLGGHSDVVLGALIFNDEKIAEDIYFNQNSTGGVCGPMDSFLVLRGIKTLGLRMARHSQNGMKVAKFLENHPKVAKVNYPGLESHPDHALAKKQMSDFGGMLSFYLKEDTVEAANKVLSNTHYFTLAESLGGVESLIGHPASMTHAAIPRDERLKTGVMDSLIRLSVGIEDVDDLISDLEQALNS